MAPWELEGRIKAFVAERKKSQRRRVVKIEYHMPCERRGVDAADDGAAIRALAEDSEYEVNVLSQLQLSGRMDELLMLRQRLHLLPAARTVRAARLEPAATPPASE